MYTSAENDDNVPRNKISSSSNQQTRYESVIIKIISLFRYSLRKFRFLVLVNKWNLLNFYAYCMSFGKALVLFNQLADKIRPSYYCLGEWHVYYWGYDHRSFCIFYELSNGNLSIPANPKSIRLGMSRHVSINKELRPSDSINDYFVFCK